MMILRVAVAPVRLGATGRCKRLFIISSIPDNQKMRKRYPGDINRAQFEAIRLMLEGARKKTLPWTVDLYQGVLRGPLPTEKWLPVAHAAG